MESLRLLHSVARHFFCAAFSTPNDRATDAQRLLSTAALCCFADRILRLRAYDAPSALSEVFSGRAPGTGEAFAFGLEAFAEESTFVLLNDPTLATARTQARRRRVLKGFELTFIPREGALSSSRRVRGLLRCMRRCWTTWTPCRRVQGKAVVCFCGNRSRASESAIAC